MKTLIKSVSLSQAKSSQKVGLVALACVFALVFSACKEEVVSTNPSSQAVEVKTEMATDVQDTVNAKTCDNRLIIDSFVKKRSDVQAKGCGTVIKVLPDDNKGSRHQKMIVRLTDSKQTILIAHNIDLAPRVEDLTKGDTLSFYGEYEYTEQGGVVHWTHHDPAGRHQGGWIEKNGKKYQ